MEVQNTNDVSLFMDQLKEWARKHQFPNIVEQIEWAERHGHTASELLLKYARVLNHLKPQLPPNLPSTYKEQWDKAIKIAEAGLQTVHYPEKKRSILSLG